MGLNPVPPPLCLRLTSSVTGWPLRPETRGAGNCPRNRIDWFFLREETKEKREEVKLYKESSLNKMDQIVRSWNEARVFEKISPCEKYGVGGWERSESNIFIAL